MRVSHHLHVSPISWSVSVQRKQLPASFAAQKFTSDVKPTESQRVSVACRWKTMNLCPMLQLVVHVDLIGAKCVAAALWETEIRNS